MIDYLINYLAYLCILFFPAPFLIKLHQIFSHYSTLYILLFSAMEWWYYGD